MGILETLMQGANFTGTGNKLQPGDFWGKTHSQNLGGGGVLPGWLQNMNYMQGANFTGTENQNPVGSQWGQPNSGVLPTGNVNPATLQGTRGPSLDAQANQPPILDASLHGNTIPGNQQPGNVQNNERAMAALRAELDNIIRFNNKPPVQNNGQNNSRAMDALRAQLSNRYGALIGPR